MTEAQARELSADEQQKRAEVCFQLDQRVRDGLRRGREALWETAEALYHFYEERAWSALGYESLGEWLADPEVGLKTAVYYRMVRSWRELVVFRKVTTPTLAKLDHTKVDLVLPAIEQGRVKVKDALADAETLGWRDLREKYVFTPEPIIQPEDRPPEATADAETAEEEILESDIGVNGEVAEDGLGEPTEDDVDAAWAQIEAAIASNAPFPRIRRETLIVLYREYCDTEEEEPTEGELESEPA